MASRRDTQKPTRLGYITVLEASLPDDSEESSP